MGKENNIFSTATTFLEISKTASQMQAQNISGKKVMCLKGNLLMDIEVEVEGSPNAFYEGDFYK
jgi:hypothetical protein